MKTILWFRRDLRLHDNPALNWVLQNSDSVLAVYIHAEAEEKPWKPGAASRWWLHHSLEKLEHNLKHHGVKLHFYSGSSEAILASLINKTQADSLVFNRLYEPHLVARDLNVHQTLNKKIQVHKFDSGLFFRPGSILNGQQQPYKVFTPFYKKANQLLNTSYGHYTVNPVAVRFKKLKPIKLNDTVSLDKLALLDRHPWHEKLHNYWQPGEKSALHVCDTFLDKNVANYNTARDIPSLEGTSCLSASLHFGEITPQQIYLNLQPYLHGATGTNCIASAEVYLKQLLWREFAHHVLWYFPHTARQPMNPRYKKSFWKSNKKRLELWQRGQTGVPIIDAGMRQLWETGWMHNRVRMIVASFLTKNLGISWNHGAKWFWDTLVDADLANNSLGWQWVAGCGVDAAPYYRIFNPLTQAKRFDSEHEYINHWAPEYINLRQLSPIVNLDRSRKIALEKYQQQITSRVE